MKTEIEKIIEDMKKGYQDRRLTVFNISVSNADDKKISLLGEVLEVKDLESLERKIKAANPAIPLDVSSVVVLRKISNRKMYVATNLTDLKAEPSWYSELLSQLKYGEQLEILKEKENWAAVRQTDGYLGWAYLPYLSEHTPEKITHLVEGPTIKLFELPEEKTTILSRLYAGTGVSVQEIKNGWVFVAAHPERIPCALPGGWTKHSGLIALSDLPKKTTQRRETIVSAAFRLFGVPYLWGGCSTNGIDCSGLAQLCYRMAGIELPRDADMQKAVGRKIDQTYQPGDLMFFGDEDNLEQISHVAISLGGWKIIHSSRSRNGVYTDDIQQVPHLKDTFAGGCTWLE